MKLVGICGFGLGLWAWLGYGAGIAVLSEVVVPFLVAMVPLLLVGVLAIRWGPLGRPIITTTLSGMLVAATTSVLVGAFLTEPRRAKLECAFLAGGTLIGLTLGVVVHVSIRNEPGLPKPGPVEREKAIRVNRLLTGFLVVLLAVSWMIPKLKWAARGSVGLAVAEGDDGLTVDLYGRAVNQRTIGVVLNNRLAYGSVERLDVFGFPIGRGFIPSDPSPGRGSEGVRRLAFHYTEVGDSVVPLLKEFKSLKKLDIRGTRISAAGVCELRSALPCCGVVR